jgi:hypothetical protein
MDMHDPHERLIVPGPDSERDVDMELMVVAVGFDVIWIAQASSDPILGSPQAEMRNRAGPDQHKCPQRHEPLMGFRKVNKRMLPPAATERIMSTGAQKLPDCGSALVSWKHCIRTCIWIFWRLEIDGDERIPGAIVNILKDCMPPEYQRRDHEP